MAQPHDPRTKAAALAGLATGESIHSVARRLGVSRSTVQRWRDAAHVPTPGLVGPQKKQELGEQVYSFLEESIETLAAQVRFARDEAWLRRQSAADLAMLFGVLNDKTVRLLAALQPDTNGAGEGA
jgi:transposase-like protein